MPRRLKRVIWRTFCFAPPRKVRILQKLRWNVRLEIKNEMFVLINIDEAKDSIRGLRQVGRFTSWLRFDQLVGHLLQNNVSKHSILIPVRIKRVEIFLNLSFGA